MNLHNKTPRILACWLTFISATAAFAQTAPASTSTGSGTVTLSPFEVTTDRDTGYAASSTLAGSRLSTELKDTPAAISVMTKDFLDDIGAINVNEALVYGLNTEAEYASDPTGNGYNAVDLQFSMRGFVGASLGRNYFAWFGSSDSYNIERLDFSRGPNSILFGIGGPGGIINTTTKRARIGRDLNEVQLRVGSWDDYRATLDVNRSLGSKFAIRTNLIWHERESWREFQFFERQGAALAMTFRPFTNTTIRFDGEYADTAENRPQPWPAADRITPWLNAGAPISQVYGQAVPGTGSLGGNGGRQVRFDPESPFGPMVFLNSRISGSGPGAPGLANNPVAITDESLLPRSTNLAGPGWIIDSRFYNWAFFVEQRVFENFDVEAAFNRQHEKRRTVRPIVFDGIALRGDPNAFLPNGQPNPNVGEYYVEGSTQLQHRDETRDDYRLTASYLLDLTDRNPLFGRHRLAGLISRRDEYNQNPGAFTERNVTPLPGYTSDLTNAMNVITRRTYLDLSSSDPARRGLHDPMAHPIVNQNGVTSGYIRNGDSSRDDLSRVDSQMAALQSSFWDQRIFLTGGIRKDRQRAWGSGNAPRDPVTREWGRRTRDGDYTYNEGTTRTYGVVYHFVPWLSFFYNKANNFRPSNARSDLLDDGLVGNQEGEGQDAGIKLRLLNDRVLANVAWYETTHSNRPGGFDAAWRNNANAIWRTLGKLDTEEMTNSNDSEDLTGDGYELEVTANLTREWRTTFNWSITHQQTSNVKPRLRAYVDRNLAEWQAASALPLDVEGGNINAATIGDALENMRVIENAIFAGEGNIRRGLRKHAGNLFTNYTFTNDSALKGFSIGAGANYRGKAVIGYDSTNNNAPIYGEDFTLVNAMVRYSRKLFDGRIGWRIQLNVDNVLDEDDLQVTDANEVQAYRYVYQNPRRWSISSTFSF